MRIDDKQVATIDLQELHDILANGELGVEHPEYGRIIPSFFKLEGRGADNTNVMKVVSKLNAIRDQLATADALFHDEFDGEFC